MDWLVIVMFVLAILMGITAKPGNDAELSDEEQIKRSIAVILEEEGDIFLN